jgi:phage virion morphogenesis protein
MATQSFNIEIRGLKSLVKRLEKASAGMANLTPAMSLIGNLMRRQVLRTFREQVDPITGQKWKKTGPLALSTRPKRGGKTMTDTGSLVASMTSQPPIVTKNTAAVGTGKEYAATHQYGDPKRTARQAKMLAIPLTREARLAGRARRWWAAQPENPFIARTKKGNMVIFKAGKPPTPSWLLRDSVSIPRRRFLGVGRREGAEIEREMTKYIAKLFGTKGPEK